MDDVWWPPGALGPHAWGTHVGPMGRPLGPTGGPPKGGMRISTEVLLTNFGRYIVEKSNQNVWTLPCYCTKQNQKVHLPGVARIGQHISYSVSTSPIR